MLSKRINLALTRKMYGRLRRVAKAKGLSTNHLIRTYLTLGLEFDAPQKPTKVYTLYADGSTSEVAHE